MTPAFFNAFIWLGVFASDFFASRSDSGSNWAKSRISSARRCTAAAQSRITVRIVPSTGRAIAAYADSDARTTAAPKSRAETRGESGSASENPQKNWAMIAPELPRAQDTASSASARDISRTCLWRILAMPPAAFWSVAARFVPVSPSGTGKILILFKGSARSATNRAPAMTARDTRPPARDPARRGTRRRSRLEVSRLRFRGDGADPGALGFLGQDGQPFEVEQDDAASHAGPRKDSLVAPVEELARPWPPPEVESRAPGADELSSAERAFSPQFVHERRAEDIAGRGTYSRESGVRRQASRVQGTVPELSTLNFPLRTPAQAEVARGGELVHALDRRRVRRLEHDLGVFLRLARDPAHRVDEGVQSGLFFRVGRLDHQDAVHDQGEGDRGRPGCSSRSGPRRARPRRSGSRIPRCTRAPARTCRRCRGTSAGARSSPGGRNRE